jgi:carbamoyl-phosphate synthase large subunit
VDCDAVFDGRRLYIGAVLEHIEEAGIHSGDSACVVPPLTLADDQVAAIVTNTESIARGLGVNGLINIQFAVKGEEVFVLEANPRASRTVPFVSKTTGVPLAKVAARVMAGETLDDLEREGLIPARRVGHDGLTHVAVKEAVMPFQRFPGFDTVLGPEMRSTGEVMGIDDDFGRAFAKAETGAGVCLPTKGTVFISVANPDKRAAIFPAKRLAELGFRLVGTAGTATMLRRLGVEAEVATKVTGERAPGGRDVVERIAAGEIDMVFNTPRGRRARSDGYYIRTAAVEAGVPCCTTMAGMLAAVQAIEALICGDMNVRPLQQYLGAGRSERG